MTFVTLHHAWKDETRYMCEGADIGVDHDVPIIATCGLRLVHAEGEPCVVHEDVDPPESIGELAYGPFQLCPVANVDRDGMNRIFSELARQRSQRFDFPISPGCGPKSFWALSTS